MFISPEKCRKTAAQTAEVAPKTQRPDASTPRNPKNMEVINTESTAPAAVVDVAAPAAAEAIAVDGVVAAEAGGAAAEFAAFEMPWLQCNEDGWGPCELSDTFRDMPYQPFSKSDRMGKISDWTGSSLNDKKFSSKLVE